VCYDQWAPLTIFPSKESLLSAALVIDMLDEIYTAPRLNWSTSKECRWQGPADYGGKRCDMLPEVHCSKSAKKDFVYTNTKNLLPYTTAFLVE
jgi:polar amino acid transport system substrate-binding protein